MELVDQKRTDIDMFEAQITAQQAETRKFKELLSEADMELEVWSGSKFLGPDFDFV